MSIGKISGMGGARRFGCAVVAVVLLLAVFAQAAGAAPFAEVGRRYGCAKGKGCMDEFGLPVGFAVAPDEENAVYVLDQTLNKPSPNGELQYRVQKLSSPEEGSGKTPGKVLGSRLGEVEVYGEEEFQNAHPVLSLAVDSSAHRIYAVVESLVEVPGEKFEPVAEELVAWSTVPNGKDELEPAPGYAKTDKTLDASVVANLEGDKELKQDLYAPEALATASNGSGNVVIEAEEGVIKNGQGSLVGGPTVLREINPEPSSGQTVGSWLAPEMPKGEVPDGLIAKSGGSYGIDLWHGNENEALLREVKEISGSSVPERLVAHEEDEEYAIENPFMDLDEALASDAKQTVNGRVALGSGTFNLHALETYSAGSPIAELSGHDYVADFGWPEEELDGQANGTPWEGARTHWYQEHSNNTRVANMGIRVFNAGGEMLTTIGGEGPGKACSLGSPYLALAAGAGNTVFVLTQPNKLVAANPGDEVVEFSEAGTIACAHPGGDLEVNTIRTTSANVKQCESVAFNAKSIERAGYTPFELDWDFGEPGEGFTLGSKIEPPRFKWPNPEAVHKYEALGDHEARLRFISDDGESTFPVDIAVTPITGIPSPPIVSLTYSPSSIMAGETVEFSASGSTSQCRLSDYEWEFNGGASTQRSGPESEPVEHHNFGSPGIYMVKLTVTENVTGQRASKEVEVAVVPNQAEKEATRIKAEEEAQAKQKAEEEAAATARKKAEEEAAAARKKAEEEAGAKTVTTPPPPSIIPPPVGVSPPGPVPVKPLTVAQKLADALKVCHKDKAHKKRVACEKAAEKEYGPKRDKKGKKK